MAVTLQAALTHNQVILGANYENLGKKSWTYLDYDQHAGWKVVKFEGCLGYIQQFLRWLGFSSSTELKTVFAQIEKEANVPPELLAKIKSCWQRRHPQLVQQVGFQPLPRVNEPVLEGRLMPDPAVENHVGMYVGNTLISIEGTDITQVSRVKGIVNAANPACLGGGGIDGVIHRHAGPALLDACRALPVKPNGNRCNTGEAVITVSGNFINNGVERIVHTVGPVGLNREALQRAYRSCLDLFHENGVRTIAIPSISTGIYGYPFDDATRLAIETVEEYAHQHPDRFAEIKLIFLPAQWNQAVAVNNAFVHEHAVRDNFMGGD